MHNTLLSIDLPALLTATLAAILCAICGTFLVARKEAMMTDTLSHAILPGLAGAYILFGTLHPLAMFSGALTSCLIASGLIFILQQFARIPPAAAMGIVFTALFALGLVLLEKFVGSKVHLDAHHALYGALELIYWPAPHDFKTLPSIIKSLATLVILALMIISLIFTPLKYASFDAVFAKTIGLPVKLTYILLLLLTTLTAVACFDAVGVVLVVALFICPPATARLFTHDLTHMIKLAVLIGIGNAIAGYMIAGFLPPALGFPYALSAGGMIATICGVTLMGAIIFTKTKKPSKIQTKHT
jgi:manganese/zinc/iron transport system permease protein